MAKNNPSAIGRSGMCERGFTLLEVMIAIAIFAIGFLAVGSMQITAINKNANARSATTVVSIAKDRAEELMSLPYTHADLVGSPAPGTAHAPAAGSDRVDNDEDGLVDEDGESGHISVRWTVVEDVPRPNTKTVRVTVTRAAGGRRTDCTLDFIKANM